VIVLTFAFRSASHAKGEPLIIASRTLAARVLFLLALVLTLAGGPGRSRASAESAALAELPQLQAQVKGAGGIDAKVNLVSDLSTSLMLSGRTEDARVLLDTVIQERADPRLIVLKARSYLCFPPTDGESAMKLLKALLKADPSNVEGLLEWARALRENHDEINAIKTYDRIIGRNPQEYRARYGKIDTFLVMRKFKEADQEAQATLKLNSKSPEALYYAGKVAERRTDIRYGAQTAIGYYRQAVAASANDTRFYAVLFFAYVVYNVPGATELLAELKARAPGDAAVAFADGLELEQRQLYGEALAKYRGAIAANANLTWAHFAAGMILGGKSISEKMRRARLPMGKNYVPIPIPRDRGGALSEFAMVRFLDPTFPLMHIVDELTSRLQYEDESMSQFLKDKEEQMKKWNSYQERLQKHQ
jgi:tetratricopeptide (TPR) repeat protein